MESGVTRVNGVIASPYYILRDGDRLEFVYRALAVMQVQDIGGLALTATAILYIVMNRR